MLRRLDGQVGRFLLAGAANTLLTYLLYLLLLAPLGHRIAYGIAYAAGIALAYALGRGFVFRRHDGWRSLLLTPLIYLVQCCFGLLIVEVWVTVLGLRAEFAPLLAIAATLPLTFVLSRWAFTRPGQG
jgi:putative flippase GtrA